MDGRQKQAQQNAKHQVGNSKAMTQTWHLKQTPEEGQPAQRWWLLQDKASDTQLSYNSSLWFRCLTNLTSRLVLWFFFSCFVLFLIKSVCLYVCRTVCLSVFIHPSLCVTVCPSVCFSQPLFPSLSLACLCLSVCIHATELKRRPEDSLGCRSLPSILVATGSCSLLHGWASGPQASISAQESWDWSSGIRLYAGSGDPRSGLPACTVSTLPLRLPHSL